MYARLVSLALLAGLVIAIPLSHMAVSQKKGKGPPPKVAICHFPDDQAEGHVIVVSRRAVPAHLGKHGDCVQFTETDTGGCRCLTCQELCEAAAEQCRDACPPQDAACLAECATELDECIADCNSLSSP